MDEVLRGRDGSRVVELDRRGRELSAPRGMVVPPVHGSHVTLRLDMRVQDVVEGVLDAAMARVGARKIMAVVVDPATGEVLGLANRPDYRRGADGGSRRNSAVCDVYEPGSTFKIVTLAGVFDLGLVRPTTSIFCHNGVYQDSTLPRPLRDHHPYGELTVTGVLAKSSNIGTYMLARQLGAGNLYRYALAFGFGQETQIGLNAEAAGKVRPLEEWSGTALSRIGMGYGVSVTPLQMVMAASAVANGGRLMRPRIVRSVDDAAGRSVLEFRPEVLRRVMNEEAAAAVRAAMVQVTQPGGTGTRGQVPGYRVAGKTGTAQKWDAALGRYSDTKYAVSFVGFLPADAPRLAAIVVVDEPGVPAAERYGGTVAAPIFAEIAGRVMGIGAGGWEVSGASAGDANGGWKPPLRGASAGVAHDGYKPSLRGATGLRAGMPAPRGASAGVVRAELELEPVLREGGGGDDFSGAFSGCARGALGGRGGGGLGVGL